jgi:hypothetical protein
MLTTQTTLSTLEQMLTDAGFDRENPVLDVFWQVFKRFAAMPVEGMDPEMDADMLLFQCALDLKERDDFSPRPHYMIDFTRQFTHEENGEYAGMEQLGCSFYYDPDPEFESVTKAADWSKTYRPGDQFWGAPADGAGPWIERVEGSPNFQSALRHEPRRVSLFQGPV